MRSGHDDIGVILAGTLANPLRRPVLAMDRNQCPWLKEAVAKRPDRRLELIMLSDSETWTLEVWLEQGRLSSTAVVTPDRIAV